MSTSQLATHTFGHGARNGFVLAHLAEHLPALDEHDRKPDVSRGIGGVPEDDVGRGDPGRIDRSARSKWCTTSPKNGNQSMSSSDATSAWKKSTWKRCTSCPRFAIADAYS